jgi:hypothetical protein
MENSPHMANAGITWENKYLNTSILINYFSSQFLDEINTITTDPYTTVDLKLLKISANNGIFTSKYKICSMSDISTVKEDIAWEGLLQEAFLINFK